MTRGGWPPPAPDTLQTETRPSQAGGFRAPCVTQKGRILNHALAERLERDAKIILRYRPDERYPISRLLQQNIAPYLNRRFQGGIGGVSASVAARHPEAAVIVPPRERPAERDGRDRTHTAR